VVLGAVLVAACGGGEPPAPRQVEIVPAPGSPGAPTAADPLGALVDAHKASAALAAAPPAPGSPGPARDLRVLVAGDLIPHRPSLAAPSAVGGALAPLGPLFGGADAVVANYEAATARADALPHGKMEYAAPQGWLAEVKRAGVSAVTIANNHACDLDAEGVTATLAGARASGLVAVGGDAEDPWTPRVIAESGGRRVCALAWTTQMNSEGACARGRQLAIASPGKRSRVTAAIERAKASCDALVAIVHGGSEYAPQTERMMELAQHAADAGADAVVLHHPHVASPAMLVTTKDARRVPVFASVGNLVSNQGESWLPTMFPVQTENRRLVCVNAWTRLGMVADLAFHFEPDGLRTDWGYHLVWTENEHATDKTVAMPRITARLLDPDTDRALVARLSQDPKGPVPVFEDPCWLENPGSEDARSHRCRVTSPRPRASPAATGATIARSDAAAAGARRPPTRAARTGGSGLSRR
jgi:poly-gamma-glutamate synthesis protein (capsule biosynthesis protein)